MSKVPILQSVHAAMEFRRHHWREVLGVLLAVALGATLNAAGELSGDKAVNVVGEAIYLLASAMGYAALIRLAFADEHAGDSEFHPGPQGFQWAKPEWRLLGVAGLMLFAYAIAAAIFIFVMVLVLLVAGVGAAAKDVTTPEGLLKAIGPAGSTAAIVLTIAFMVMLVYVAVRISLAPAATVSRKRISVFDTWPLTKGQVWPIFAATFLVSLPSIAAAVVVNLILNQTGQPTGVKDALQIAMPGALIVGLIPGLVVSFVQLPLSVGLVAYLFRGLRPPGEAAH